MCEIGPSTRVDGVYGVHAHSSTFQGLRGDSGARVGAGDA